MTIHKAALFGQERRVVERDDGNESETKIDADVYFFEGVTHPIKSCVPSNLITEEG